MEKLSIKELHALRITILENAKALQNEASVLFSNGMYSRAYLLAHFCAEELGKIPIIIVDVIVKLENNEFVDWKTVKKQFYNHQSKMAIQNGDFYAFSQDLNLSGDSRIEWLLNANEEIPEAYRKKNISTYVDVVNGKILSPLNEISEADARKMIDYAVSCVNAHERIESLINPLLYKE